MPLSKLISQLRSEDISRSAKTTMIRTYCENHEWVKEVLKYTYDPFNQYFIKTKFPRVAVKSSSSSLVKFDEKFWAKFVKPILIKLNHRELDAVSITQTIISFLGILNDDDQDLLKSIITKDLRIGFAAKSINSILNENLIPVSDCQLCKTYDPNMVIKNVDVWYASRKMNGLRGRFKSRDGEFVFLTREDYPLVGFDEIVAELEAIRDKYNLSLIDGEVFSLNLPFQYIMSIARNEKNIDLEKKKLLKFNIFNVQVKDKTLKTSEMVKLLHRIFKENTFNYLVEVKYETVENESSAIIAKCKKYTDEGYEGIVLRDPTVSFEGGKRNNHLLKYKLFNETDLTVTEILYGEVGKKWEHSVTALKCEGTIKAKKIEGMDIYMPAADDDDDPSCKKLLIEVEATCSSCTNKERKELTLKAETNPSDIIGRTIEVKYQAITDKPNDDGVYSLQFPVFLKFKDM